MTRTVPLNRIDTVLAAFSYPITPAEVADAEPVTVELAAGTGDLRETVGQSSATAFDSPEELHAELLSLLPREAVGEPFQSEGEG